MPELPEVETIVRQLRPHVLNKKITNVQVFRPGQWKQSNPDDAAKVLAGDSFADISRRAKFITLKLASDYMLVIHLRMSGKLMWVQNCEPLNQYTRTLFCLEDDTSLQFNDTRALGTIDLYAPVTKPECLEKLGIEPLENHLNEIILKELLSSSRLEIKDFLMNQNKVCGIGNIYANEILFHCKIHPQRKTNTLTSVEIKHLAQTIPAVLKKAIERMGTTLGNSASDFRTVYNIEGDFQSLLKVYGRAGESCDKCGTEIIRIVQKGRSSFVCENCQK